jgi:hypothetical protein
MSVRDTDALCHRAFRDPSSVENLGGPGMDRQCLGMRVSLLSGLQDCHGGPSEPQFPGKPQPGGTDPYHDDITQLKTFLVGDQIIGRSALGQ